MSRPRIGPKVQTHIPEWAFRYINKMTKEDGGTRSDVVRDIIVIGIACLQKHHSHKKDAQ